MRNYNWIVDIIFGMFMALFFLLVTSDIIAESIPIHIKVGEKLIVGHYNDSKGEIVLRESKLNFKQHLDLKIGVPLEKVLYATKTVNEKPND